MPTLHLTFDDGPHETFTPAILDVLAAHDAHATFFQAGRLIELRPHLTKRVRDAGHGIGSHAWSHTDLASLDDDQLDDELSRTSAIIEETTGRAPTLLRPPFGSPFRVTDTAGHPRQEAVRSRAEALGMKTIVWDIAPEDWNRPGRAAIAERVLRDPGILAGRSGLVVLLHDGECADEAENVAGVETILSTLGERGYTFEPIPDTYAGSALAERFMPPAATPGHTATTPRTGCGSRPTGIRRDSTR